MRGLANDQCSYLLFLPNAQQSFEMLFCWTSHERWYCCVDRVNKRDRAFLVYIISFVSRFLLLYVRNHCFLRTNSVLGSFHVSSRRSVREGLCSRMPQVACNSITAAITRLATYHSTTHLLRSLACLSNRYPELSPRSNNPPTAIYIAPEQLYLYSCLREHLACHASKHGASQRPRPQACARAHPVHQAKKTRTFPMRSSLHFVTTRSLFVRDSSRLTAR
jgi:hypothetical protein